MGVFLRRFPQVRTDFPALIDEWASRFFEELDYIKEGNNGIRFSKFMAKELPQARRPSSQCASPEPVLASAQPLQTGHMLAPELHAYSASCLCSICKIHGLLHAITESQ